LAVVLILLVWTGCRQENPMSTGTPVAAEIPTPEIGEGHRYSVTGDVEFIWNGGAGHEPVVQEASRRAFLAIVAFEPTATRPACGSATYTVTDRYGAVHRQIVVAVEDVRIDAPTKKTWYRGVVVSDTKGCSGGPDGGHDSGCSGDTGGCTDDHDHTEGGCTGDDGHDTGHDGGCSGGNGHNGGPNASGRSCRVGQYFVGRAHDLGTPAMAGDGIAWKWFDADDPGLPTMDSLDTWPHLCRKSLLGGNIAVHI